MGKQSKNNNVLSIGTMNQSNETYSKLDYFCKNHNKLCCLSCIAKIKGEGIGQHKDCDVFFIKEIKDEKINKLKENPNQNRNLKVKEAVKKMKKKKNILI